MWKSAPAPNPPPPPTPLVDSQGRPVALVLYKFDACFFCRRVTTALQELGYSVPTRDTRRDPEALQEALRIGGRTQVPMLTVNGVPLYESRDIVNFLRNEVRPA